MFGKKKKILLEDLPEVVVSVEDDNTVVLTQSENNNDTTTSIQEENNDVKQFNDEETKTVENTFETEDNQEENIKTEGWIWANVDSEEILPIEEINEETKEEKLDLNSFFQASKQKRRLSRKERKQYSKKELKRRKKRQKEGISDEITNQRTYKFKKKKYKNVEDFIAYLNDHYLDIDDIAIEVLKDERFFGWVGHHSGVFPQSLKQFKEIQKQLDTK